MVRRAAAPEVDSIDVELIAIGVLGKALTPLDADARVRVLRWANERFKPELTPVQAVPLAVEPPALPAIHLAPEPDLTVDGLDNLCEVPADLFGERDDRVQEPADFVETPAGPLPALHLAPEPDLTVDDLHEMFEAAANRPPAEVEEHTTVALIAAEDLSDLYEPHPEPARPLLHLVPREELPFDQLVDDFVDSFRRLTRDWQGV